jgi:hypothetical protein
MMRGWPILIGVKFTAPDGSDGGLGLPTEEKEWQTVIGLTLSDRAGAPVTLPIERLPVADLPQSNLKASDSRTVWFRVAGEATRSLGEGPHRWAAKFSLAPARSRPEHLWSGTVTAMSAPVAFVAPPAPLPAELARRHTWALVEDALIDAELLRARAEGGYMDDRTIAAQQAAVPLHRAERLALQWHEAHPDDSGGAVLVANVMAAQEDKDRALLFLRRGMAAEQRQRPPGGGDAAEPSFALRLMGRAFESMPDELDPVLTPALRAALKEVRAGELPPPPPTFASPPAAAAAPTHANPSAPAASGPVAPPRLRR